MDYHFTLISALRPGSEKPGPFLCIFATLFGAVVIPTGVFCSSFGHLRHTGGLFFMPTKDRGFLRLSGLTRGCILRVHQKLFKMKKKIYCYVNTGRGTDMQTVIALCEDGHCLAQHLSSNEAWAKHDIGITSEQKHENYKEHCPGGYELIWLDVPEDSEELKAAYKLNQVLWEQAAAVKTD